MAIQGLHSHVWLELQNHGRCGLSRGSAVPHRSHLSLGDPTLCYVSSGVMWLEVWVHSDPGCTSLSSVVLGKLLNLLVAQWSHLYNGDNIAAYLIGPMCGLKEIRVMLGKHSITVS